MFSLASKANIDEDLQGWAALTTQFPIHNKIKGYIEIQPRFSNNLRILVRPAVYYQINPHLSVWQGYAWVATPEQHNLNNKNRLWPNRTRRRMV